MRLADHLVEVTEATLLADHLAEVPEAIRLPLQEADHLVAADLQVEVDHLLEEDHQEVDKQLN